jgi:tetratricopeptide (TPR) repeat protein
MQQSSPSSPCAAVVVLCLFGWLVGLPTPAPSQNKATTDSSVVERARRAATEGRREEAIDIIDRALAAGRRSSELYDLRGQLHQALGDEQAAERDWRRAADLDAANAAPRIALARLHLQRGLWPDAIRTYREVLLRHPRHVDAILGLSEALRRMGRTVGAQRLIEAAGQTIRDPRVQQRWAQVALESGRPDEAERALKQIAANLTGAAKREVIQRLAELYVGQGRYQEALAALEEARAIGGSAGQLGEQAYDLLAEATDNLIRLRISDLVETLQQLDAAKLSREEALQRAEATRAQLGQIDQLVAGVTVPKSREPLHASRLYAYSLASEAAFNALAYIDLGLASKRDDFANRWRAAQTEMALLRRAQSAGG